MPLHASSLARRLLALIRSCGSPLPLATSHRSLPLSDGFRRWSERRGSPGWGLPSLRFHVDKALGSFVTEPAVWASPVRGSFVPVGEGRGRRQCGADSLAGGRLAAGVAATAGSHADSDISKPAAAEHSVADSFLRLPWIPEGRIVRNPSRRRHAELATHREDLGIWPRG